MEKREVITKKDMNKVLQSMKGMKAVNNLEIYLKK